VPSDDKLPHNYFLLKNMKKIMSIFLALFSLLLIASPVFAEDEIKRLTVDLKTKGFTQEIWQDSLDSSNILLGPNDKIQYQIRVKNEGNRNQTWIEVNTKLPSTIITSESMSFKISQLTPNEEYIKNITVTLKDKSYLNKAITKNTIYTSIKAESGLTWSDESSFYSNNGTKEAISTSSAEDLPNSGMPILLSTLVGSSLIGFGIFARKFARGY
jgi:hypothetical protein